MQNQWLAYFLIVTWFIVAIIVIIQLVLWTIEIWDGDRWERISTSSRTYEEPPKPINLDTLKDRLSFSKLEYQNHRREARLDTVFGFKSWDSEDVDNFSSMEDTKESDQRP